ncbi:MAG: HAMP domain-containing sensor histidine kinase [Anaerolineales bacterium]|jgi:signal transduction histidine kinase|nr:HAMP domain-containing sensor histidine kinase [Anaerolineales bacterium]
MKANLLSWLNKGRFLDLNVLQWAVPLFLSVTALLFEFVEHSLEGELRFDLAFMSETIIFGLMGPVIVGFIIAWMRELVNAERQAMAEVHVLNRELENKVAERTTALEERNAELAHANQELQHLDEMKSEFVSLVSHELRAPLTTLNGGLELALQHADTLPDSARRTLETMVGESNRLTQLVQRILDVSRLEAGKLEINPGPVAVRPLMEQAADVTLIPKGRHVEWEFTDNLPPVWADEVHLEEIIRNLMRNAEKYSPPETDIVLCACQQDGYVRISVKDHGLGILPEYQENIFERFGRAQRGESAPPGWGLGLYFARKLIEAQRGSIHVISPIWQDAQAPGAEFYLLVPVATFSEE